MEQEKSIYEDILKSAISWRVRDMYNLYGTIRRVLFEGRKAERAAMLSELIKMQGGNIGGSAKVETLDDRLTALEKAPGVFGNKLWWAVIAAFVSGFVAYELAALLH